MGRRGLVLFVAAAALCVEPALAGSAPMSPIVDRF
jgi:hypothetical protein